MKLAIRSKPTLLLATLATAALLLSACTAQVIPIPVPVPITAAGGAAAAATAEAAAAPEATATPAEEAPAATSATPEALALEGVTWQVTEARGADGTLAPANATATLALENGQVSGSGGCNNFFAGYTLDGSSLKFDQAGSTMMACEDAAMAFEQAFLASLADVASYTIVGDRLHLFAADGSLLLSAVPAVPADAAADTNPDPVDVAAKAAPVELDTAQDQAASGVVLAPLASTCALAPARTSRSWGLPRKARKARSSARARTACGGQ